MPRSQVISDILPHCTFDRTIQAKSSDLTGIYWIQCGNISPAKWIWIHSENGFNARWERLPKCSEAEGWNGRNEFWILSRGLKANSPKTWLRRGWSGPECIAGESWIRWKGFRCRVRGIWVLNRGEDCLADDHCDESQKDQTEHDARSFRARSAWGTGTGDHSARMEEEGSILGGSLTRPALL